MRAKGSCDNGSPRSNAECEQEITALQAAVDPQTIPVREVTLSARKSDIAVGRVALLWAPWREDSRRLAATCVQNLRIDHEGSGHRVESEAQDQ